MDGIAPYVERFGRRALDGAGGDRPRRAGAGHHARLARSACASRDDELLRRSSCSPRCATSLAGIRSRSSDARKYYLAFPERVPGAHRRGDRPHPPLRAWLSSARRLRRYREPRLRVARSFLHAGRALLLRGVARGRAAGLEDRGGHHDVRDALERHASRSHGFRRCSSTRPRARPPDDRVGGAHEARPLCRSPDGNRGVVRRARWRPGGGDRGRAPA